MAENAGEWSPFRSRDLEPRLRHLENQVIALSVSDSAAIDEDESGAVVVTTPPPSTGVIPEENVDFDAAEGHVHDGVESTPINLIGDVSGTNITNVVDKIKSVTAPTPVAGDTGKVLTYIHATPAYALHTLPFKVVSKTANYTATEDDLVIICDATAGAITVTLPAASGRANKAYFVKKIDASVNTVTIDGNASETIDDALTYVISAQYLCITVVCDGTEWWIV